MLDAQSEETQGSAAAEMVQVANLLSAPNDATVAEATSNDMACVSHQFSWPQSRLDLSICQSGELAHRSAATSPEPFWTSSLSYNAAAAEDVMRLQRRWPDEDYNMEDRDDLNGILDSQDGDDGDEPHRSTYFCNTATAVHVYSPSSMIEEDMLLFSESEDDGEATALLWSGGVAAGPCPPANTRRRIYSSDAIVRRSDGGAASRADTVSFPALFSSALPAVAAAAVDMVAPPLPAWMSFASLLTGLNLKGDAAAGKRENYEAAMRSLTALLMYTKWGDRGRQSGRVDDAEAARKGNRVPSMLARRHLLTTLRYYSTASCVTSPSAPFSIHRNSSESRRELL